MKAILKRDDNFALITYTALSIFILRSILFINHRLGFNHDWNFPCTAYELNVYVNQAFYLLHDKNLGTHIVYPSQYLLQYILIPFSYFGFSGLIAIKLILFFIFVLSGYFMYLLLRKSFKLLYIPSLISGIFYMTTPVVFNKIVAGHILYLISYALSPIIIIYFIKYIDSREIKYLTLTGLLLAFASIQVQFSVMLIGLILLYSFLVAKTNLPKIIRTTLFLTLIVVLINSFWILPCIINFSGSAETLKVASNVKSLESWDNPLLDAFGLIGYRSHHFSTALSSYSYRYIWNISSLFLLVLIFSSLLICKHRIPLYFGIISIVILIFTTALSDPFGSVIYFLYSNFSIFNLFREVYHLTFLISFSYSVMLAFTLHSIYKRLKINKLIPTVLIVGIIIAYNPFIYTGNFSGQVQIYKFDNHDISLINGYTESDQNYRVLYLPMILPFKYENLKYNGIDPIITYSKKPTIGNYANSEFIRYMSLNMHNSSKNVDILLDISSIKYIFIRNNYQSMLPHYLDRGKYKISNESYDIRSIWKNKNIVKTIKNQHELTLIDRSKNILVFENRNFLPLVYPVSTQITTSSFDEFFWIIESDDFMPTHQNIIIHNQNKNEKILKIDSTAHPHIFFQKINPTKYKIKIENAEEPFYLTFSESFNPGWQTYINTDTMQCNPIATYENVNVTECNPESKLFEVRDITRIFSDPIPEENHFMANGYANAWYIDPQQLGTGENFTVTLYFKPQSYFYIGLIISGLTFILCVGFLFWDWRKRTTTKLQTKVII